MLVLAYTVCQLDIPKYSAKIYLSYFLRCVLKALVRNNNDNNNNNNNNNRVSSATLTTCLSLSAPYIPPHLQAAQLDPLTQRFWFENTVQSPMILMAIIVLKLVTTSAGSQMFSELENWIETHPSWCYCSTASDRAVQSLTFSCHQSFLCHPF